MSFTPEQPNRLEKIVRWAKDHASPSEQTLYIESIQTDQLRSSVMEAINAEGFRDTYDFFYLPRCFQSKKNKGYAFINFINPEAAREFSLVINAKRKLQRSNWVVKTSSLQGLQANVAKWARSRSVRIRDPEVLPYLRGLKELEGVHPMRAIAPDCSDMPVPERLNLGVKVVQDEVVMEPVAPSYNVGPSYNPGPSYSAGPSYNMFDYKIHGCSIYFQETVHPAPGLLSASASTSSSISSDRQSDLLAYQAQVYSTAPRYARPPPRSSETCTRAFDLSEAVVLQRFCV